MANAPIPTLPIATSLDGTEQMECVQPPGSGGTTKRLTTGQVAALAGVGASPPAGTFILATQNTGLANSRVLTVSADLTLTDNGAQSSIVIGPITTAAITYPKFQQTPPLSVLGQSSSATGIIDSMVGTANQVFRVAPSGTSLGFGQINLSATAAVTGFLSITAFLTGIVTVPLGGTGTGTLTANGILYGNGTSSVGVTPAGSAEQLLKVASNGTTIQFGQANLSTSAAVTGILPVPFGGSGTSALTANGVLYGNGTSAVGVTSAGSAEQVLKVAANGTTVQFGQIDISTSAAVTGTLAVPFGGTGATTLAAFGVLYGNGTSAVAVATAGVSGQLLIGQTSTSAPIFRTSTGDLTYSAVGTATIATNAVTFAKYQQVAGLSVVGVTGSATANVGAITGTLDQVLRVANNGTSLTFGAINLSTSAAVTGSVGVQNGGTGGNTTATGFSNLKQAATTATTGVLLQDAPTYQVFTSGTGTYNTPANCKWIRVELIGAGGGGAGSGTGAPGTGGTGGTTTFDTVTGNGGVGGSPNSGTPSAGGSAANGNVNITGSVSGSGALIPSGSQSYGGSGAGSYYGGGPGITNGGGNPGTAGTSPGAGGSGGTAAAHTSFGNGGGSGGYARKTFIAPAATYSYAVGLAGTAGTAGTGGQIGGAGAPGIIIVEEHYN